ncbi:hypothetical protein TYRP_013450 [Tyrophagus putrescentiae]|nr:hypothetical protein TYRP_013450 [Tyrophagus putrescentiae]
MLPVLIFALLLLQAKQSDLLTPSQLSFTTIELNEALSMTSNMQSAIDGNITRPYFGDYTQRNSSHIAAIQVNVEGETGIDYHQKHFIDLLKECTNVLLAVKDDPSSGLVVVSKAYFLLPKQQEMLYFSLTDITFDQNVISPCVTEEHLHWSKLVNPAFFHRVFYCPLVPQNVTSLVESTGNFTDQMLRPHCANVLMQEGTADEGQVTVYFVFKDEDASLYRHTVPFFNETSVDPCYTNEDLSKIILKKNSPKSLTMFIVVVIILVVCVVALLVFAIVRLIIRKRKSGIVHITYPVNPFQQSTTRF